MARSLIEHPTARNAAILARGREVVRNEADALAVLVDALDDRFVLACHMIAEAKRRLVVTGMGKSGHIARKVAATFAATGTPAFYMHPAEAAHGDLGMLTSGDVLLVLSNSGNTAELRPVLDHARRVGVRIVGVASRPGSLVIERADIALCLPPMREACSANIAPTTSTTLQLALGDALALTVMDMRGISVDDLRSFHPGGAIGLRLTPVSDIMHGARQLPVVAEHSGMADVISTMTRGGFGIAGVIDGRGDLIGVITDGDLRRHFAELDSADAAAIMTRGPRTITACMTAEEALRFLNDEQITAAFVVERRESGYPLRPVGIVHVHDFLRVGLG
ncbi:MAG: KpsF/GutQ family sugar-phosphate isomerase [Sphingobium sp.]